MRRHPTTCARAGCHNLLRPPGGPGRRPRWCSGPCAYRGVQAPGERVREADMGPEVPLLVDEAAEAAALRARLLQGLRDGVPASALMERGGVSERLVRETADAHGIPLVAGGSWLPHGSPA